MAYSSWQDIAIGCSSFKMIDVIPKIVTMVFFQLFKLFQRQRMKKA